MTTPILIYYGPEWETLYRCRQCCMAEALAEHGPVYYLSPPRLRGSFTEWHRPAIERISENLSVVHNAFGVRTTRLGKRTGAVAASIDSRWLHKLLAQTGVKEYILWLGCVAPQALLGMRTDKLIFDNIDPCFSPSFQAEFDRQEASIVRRSRLVFATAGILLDKMTPQQPNSHILPNAACIEDHHPDYTRNLPIPEPLRGNSRPVVGFLGTFDWRIDYSTLTAAAKALPEYTFALVGRVNQDQEHNMQGLRALSNVLLPGMVSQEHASAYTAAFDVALIPYAPGPIGDAINPSKMYCYLMAGKAIVSTWLPETRNEPDFVRASRSPDEFVAAIRQAIGEDSEAERARRIAYGMANTYPARAATAIGHMRATGLMP